MRGRGSASDDLGSTPRASGTLALSRIPASAMLIAVVESVVRMRIPVDSALGVHGVKISEAREERLANWT